VITITAGGYAPEDSTHTAALRHLASHLVDELGGTVAIEVVPNIMDQGRPNSDLLDLVESGGLTLCYFSTSYLGRRVPELDALEIPFLFDTLASAHRALDGAFGAWLTAATERRTGFSVLGYWDNGFRHLTNAVRAVHTPQDVAGLRVRLQPNATHEAMIEAWGATAVPVELRRGIEMLMSRDVDAQENPLANTVAYRVDRIHPYVTMTGHLYGARGVFASRTALEALPARVVEALRGAVASAVAWQRAAAERYESECRTAMEASGVEFVDPTEDEREAFVAATGPVVRRTRATLGGAPWPM
jgi:TRAP-type transport system periplasmic protein